MTPEMQRMATAELDAESDLDRYIDERLDEESCSMCGATTHTERERTDDGEWDEDCEFHPYFDGDDNDLRRPRSSW